MMTHATTSMESYTETECEPTQNEPQCKPTRKKAESFSTAQTDVNSLGKTSMSSADYYTANKHFMHYLPVENSRCHTPTHKVAKSPAADCVSVGSSFSMDSDIFNADCSLLHIKHAPSVKLRDYSSSLYSTE